MGIFPQRMGGELDWESRWRFSVFLVWKLSALRREKASEPENGGTARIKAELAFLALFYLGGLALVVGIVPWEQIGLDKSPFVTVFEKVGIPAAGHIMNFVCCRQRCRVPFAICISRRGMLFFTVARRICTAILGS